MASKPKKKTKKKYDYGTRYSKEKLSPYRDQDGSLFDPKKDPKPFRFYGLKHVDLDNDTKVNPESISLAGDEHRSRRFPTRSKPPEEVFNDPKKKALWDQYWEEQDRWWSDILQEESRSKSLYNKKRQDG